MLLTGTAEAQTPSRIPGHLASIDPEVEDAIRERGTAPVVVMIFDQDRLVPWRNRADFDAKNEIMVLEQELAIAEASIPQSVAPRSEPQTEVEPIDSLSFQRFGGFANAVINAQGLEILRQHRLVERIGIDPGYEFAQLAETDFEESARIGMSQSSSLAIGSGLHGSGVHIAVLDGNIVTQHPALAAVDHERCFTGVKSGSVFDCTAASGPGVAAGPVDNDWSHGTGVTGLIMAQRQADAIVPFALRPFLGPASAATVTAIRVTDPRPIPNTNPQRFTHSPSQANVINALEWVNGEIGKAGGRPFSAVNMSFARPYVQTIGDDILNDDYLVQNCDRLLDDQYSNPTFLIQTLATLQIARRRGVVAFAATGNDYMYSADPLVTARSRRAPGVPACLSPVIGVSAVWDNTVNEPALSAEQAATGSTCDAAINRNACYAQRNKNTKLAAGGSTIRSPWVLYGNNSVPPGTPLPSYATSETWALYPPLGGFPPHRPLHGTSFAAPLAAACYGQLIQNFGALAGYPGLDRRDLITRLINEPTRSTRVDVNGIPFAEDVEVPLLRCSSALSRANSGMFNPVSLGLPMLNRFILSGAWSHIDISGQGFVIEVNPYPSPTSPLVFGGWFTYSVAGGGGVTNQRWFALQNTGTLSPSTTTIELGVYQTTGGTFPNLPASITQAGTATLRFHNCLEATLRVSMFASSYVGVQERVFKLQRTQPPQRCHENDLTQADIDAHPNMPNWETGIRHYGRSGAWYNPTSGGQGLLIEQNANRDLPFIAWYTQSPSSAGNNEERLRWFILQPLIDPTTNQGAIGTYGLNVMNLRIYQVTGGTFATAGSVNLVEVGTASLTAVDGALPGACNDLNLNYNFFASAAEFANLNGLISLQKIGAAHPSCTGP